MQSVEFAHAITRTVLALPERKQLHGSAGATNSSDMLGPFPRVAADAAGRFNCLHKEKAKLYANGIVAAGGPVSGDPGELASPSPVGNDRVPFNYHEMHIKVYEDLTHYFCGRAIIDLTCSDGVAIIHSIQQRHASEEHKRRAPPAVPPGRRRCQPLAGSRRAAVKNALIAKLSFLNDG